VSFSNGSRVLALMLVLACLAGAAGCSSANSPRFVDKGASYDASSAVALSGRLDIQKLKGVATSESADLRHEALVSLRARGGRAAEVADVLTKTFPSDTRAVPIYFERATFDGKPVILVIEAAGPANGTLSTKRVWVLDEQGNVVFMGSR
jgi:hypothetical protein